MISALLWTLALMLSVALIVWGAETFAKHLATASRQLGISSFALALLLAGAEPEELATAVAATLRKAPAIAIGDVIGANVTILLVALGVGAIISGIPFGRRVIRYAFLGLPISAVAVWFAWNGMVTRLRGFFLVLLYVAYVAAIWIWERKPPALGEVEELQEQHEGTSRRSGVAVLFAFLGVIAMSVGATALVEAVLRLSHAENTEAVLGLTLVGFATGFELVVLAWSAARHGAPEATVAAVVGSFTYNLTMTMGAAAMIRPLKLASASEIHLPFVIMLAGFVFVILLATRRRRLGRKAGFSLLLTYGCYVAAVLWVWRGL